MKDMNIFNDNKPYTKDDIDGEVMSFINDFIIFQGKEKSEVLRTQFMCGYCYHFAKILQSVFKRGTCCICAPYGHVVWQDENGVAYDLDGVYYGDAEYLISEEFAGDLILDFVRRPNCNHNTTKEEIEDLMKRYKEHLEEKEVLDGFDIKVKWTGRYPTLCQGEWELEINGKNMSYLIPSSKRNKPMYTRGHHKLIKLNKNGKPEQSVYLDGLPEEDWIKENQSWLSTITDNQQVYKKLYILFRQQDWRKHQCGGCL